MRLQLSLGGDIDFGAASLNLLPHNKYQIVNIVDIFLENELEMWNPQSCQNACREATGRTGSL